MLASEYFKESGMEPEAVEMFVELCRRVGTTLDDPALDVGDAGIKVWHYEAYEWTEKEEKVFEKWVVNWMFNHKAVFGHQSKRVIRLHVVPMWLLNYSWRYKI